MKFYITKYALSEGIYAVEAERTHTETMIRVIGSPSALSQYFHGEGRDFHTTPESALQRAEVMRLKAIESAKKRLAALQNLKFSVPE